MLSIVAVWIAGLGVGGLLGCGIGHVVRSFRISRSEHPGFSCCEASRVVDNLSLDRSPSWH